MKKVSVILFFIAFATPLVNAQEQSASGVVKLRGTRLTYPLVRKWILEFNKAYPGIQVSIAPTAPADSIDFSIASYALSENDLGSTKKAVVVTRYVQLPVVNINRPGLSEWQAKGISEKNFNELFFPSTTPSLFASTNAQPVIYVRERPTCAVKAFATHYGKDPKAIKGTGVKGDDEDLADAVRNDVNGIAFNNLGFIYDVKTRLVGENLAIIPLDLNENGKVDRDEQIYGKLDDVIAYIERTHNPKFVNERVNFVFKQTSQNAAAGIFLRWALDKGQRFNHELGFLNLDEKFIAEQKSIAATVFNPGASSCEGADALMKQRKVKQ